MRGDNAAQLPPAAIVKTVDSVSASNNANKDNYPTIGHIPLSGDRKFITILFPDGQELECLYDTGAQLSIMSEDVFETFEKFGFVEDRVEAPNLNPTGVGGTNLDVVGTYRIRMRIFDLTKVVPFAVIRNMKTEQCIMGITCIRAFHLAYDPHANVIFRQPPGWINYHNHATEQVPDVVQLEQEDPGEGHSTRGRRRPALNKPRLPDVSRTPKRSRMAPDDPDSDPEAQQAVQAVSRPSFPGASDVTAKRTYTINPRTAKLLAIKPHDKTGRPVQPGKSVIMQVGLQTVCHVVGSDGFVEHYVRNPDHAPRKIQRGEVLGTVLSVDDWEVLTTEQDKRKAFGEMISAVTGEQPQRAKKKLSGVMRKKIELAVEKFCRNSRHRAFAPQLRALLREFHYIFAEDKHDLGRVPQFQHELDMNDDEPVYTQQFPIPTAHLAEIKESIQEWLRHGIIERADSKYNSPIFCVKKKDGVGLRVVLDFRRVNARTLPSHYCIRTVQDCIAELGNSGAKVFSGIDLKAAFWQLPLREQDRDKTAFTVPGTGTFRWTVACMGLAGCPATFSKMMETILSDPLTIGRVINYIDDTLVFSKDFQTHLTDLRNVFSVMAKWNLRINLEKCQFAEDSIDYLGHRLTPDGILPGRDKTQALASAPPPKTTKEIQRFIGMANYFRCYIPNFATRVAPLAKMSNDQATLRTRGLPEEALAAFNDIRQVITSPQVLGFPRREGDYILTTDASVGNDTFPGGYGAMLEQEQEDGRVVIGFASRAMQKHCRNYTAFMAEVGAAVFGIEAFSHHLRGRRFKLRVDHRPLTKLTSNQTRSLNALAAKCADFDFSVEYSSKDENAVADFFSRMGPLTEPCLQNPGQITQEGIQEGDDIVAVVDCSAERTALMQKADEQCRRWFEAVQEAEASNLPAANSMLITDGVLYIDLKGEKSFAQEPGPRIVVPATMREELLLEAHAGQNSGHTGEFKTLRRLKSHFWWPGMAQDVKRICKECKVCARCTDKGANQPPHLRPLPIPPPGGTQSPHGLVRALQERALQRQRVHPGSD